MDNFSRQKNMRIFSNIRRFLLLPLLLLSLSPTLSSAQKENALPISLNGDVSAKIIGGTDATPGAWPWMTALVSRGQSASASHFCGGALIASNWVLTAAHCVEGNFASSIPIDVVIGRQVLTDRDGERRQVKSIWLHPNYNSSSLTSDIALLELDKPSSQTPLNLVTPELMNTIGNGDSTTVIGWGATEFNGFPSSYPNVLQEVDVNIIPNAICGSSYGNITDEMLCAGVAGGGKDSCNGDSGGPLMYQSNGSWYQVGIVSFGTGCALAGYPGVYTRVASYINWMENTTGLDLTPKPVCEPDLESDLIPNRNSDDSDGDGITDDNENSSGSDPNDPGSYTVNLDGQAIAFWSGYLNMINILELINNGDTTTTVSVKLHTKAGVACNQLKNIQIHPGQELDLILNDQNAFPGFRKNSYGLVTISFTGGSLDGRMSYYRGLGGVYRANGPFEFAYSLPLTLATYGTSAVSFNTFQPSRNIFEAYNMVPNWLSLINLSSSEKSFTVITFDLDGAELKRQTIAVSARGRKDIDGGHVLVGENQLGYHKIIPTDADAPYSAFLIRYGNNTPKSVQPTAFDFATALFTKAGNGQPQLVPLTTTLNSENWLEVINTRNSAINVEVVFYKNNGEEVGRPPVFTLAANSQVHFLANEFLGKEGIGHAVITSSERNSIIAQSMVYIKDSAESILSSYASQAKQALGSSLKGTYNLFLNMENWLKLINPNNSEVTLNLTLKHLDGTSTNKSVTIPANGSSDLGFHDFARFRTSANTFGTIEINSSSNVFISELLRLKKLSGTQTVDFAFPTQVR